MEYKYGIVNRTFVHMILVTGGTGLIGAQLLLDITKSGKTVRAIKRSTSNHSTVTRTFANNPELLSKIEWVDGDILDVYSVLAAMKGIKQVYHCAACVSFHPRDFDYVMKVNVGGTANIVNMALETGIEKLCHVSSVAAIGRSEQ